MSRQRIPESKAWVALGYALLFVGAVVVAVVGVVALLWWTP